MKKLLLEIFGMMLACMGLVYGISSTAKLIMTKTNNFNSNIMYYITLIAGLCGLILFAILLNIIVIRRLKRLSHSVGEVAHGNYETKISDKGIDEIHDLTQDFNAMTQELKSNEYLSRQFVRNVSHELKTPLSCIMGYAELMTAPSASSDEIRKYAEIIFNQSKHTMSIAEQMLELSKLSSTQLVVKEDNFSADEQIRSIILSMQNAWQTKNIGFDIDLCEANITLNAALTYHIWQNLISNAIKFTPNGGTIKVLLTNSDSLIFTISNSGNGIPKDAQPHIFNQFFTADNCGENHGSGLGLPIVKAIVNKLGGSVDFTSNINDYTTFVVKL